MRPLDRLPSLKAKLGVVIVAAVAVTVVVVSVGVRQGIPILPLAVVAGALALLMVQLLARGMTSPLREMSSAARDMATGDYERRVSATSRDEVGELAHAFNRMAADLAETDRIRRDLIANVSHDLRTPISALRAKLENLIDGVASPDEATLEAMMIQVDRLGRLVAQLLELSRLEAGTVALRPEPFRVADLLSEMRQPFELRGEDVSFEVDVQPADLQIVADRERLGQVISNLLENSVRYSPPGGCVAISVRAKGQRVRFVVSDEGPGVAAGEEDRIFERFYRSDSARSASGGAGLGLAISRWIVDLHHGTIRAENRKERGTDFVVELGGAV